MGSSLVITVSGVDSGTSFASRMKISLGKVLVLDSVQEKAQVWVMASALEEALVRKMSTRARAWLLHSNRLLLWRCVRLTSPVDPSEKDPAAGPVVLMQQELVPAG